MAHGRPYLFWAGEAIGWRTLATEKWLIQTSVGYEEGREEGDFGVDAQQPTDSGLPVTDVDSGYRSTGFNVNYRQHVAPHWQVFGEALYEIYGSDVSDSPVSRNDYEAEIGIGFVYVF